MAKRAIKDSDFLRTMRERFKLACDASTEQDQREQDDIAFEDGQQWPVEVELARKGQQPINGMPAVPARPTLVFDKVKAPIRQTLNQERAADIGIELVPADDFGDLGITPDDTEIVLREGMTRRIQRESSAADARTWAYKRAVIAGRGYYMVMTRFLPGATWDQEVYVHRIYNQAGVKLDPAHEAPDGSDADWEFLGTWMPLDRFQAEYPKDADGEPNPLSDCNDTEFMSLVEAYPSWYRAEGEQKSVRIVDYWHTERESRTIVQLPDGRGVFSDEMPEDAASDEMERREVVEKTIKFCKTAGGVVELERTDWAGPDMPIIKVIGEEVLPYDEQRRYIGQVRPVRGACQGFNYMGSKFVEVVGLAPIPTLNVDPAAIEGYESWWDRMNTRTFPYAPSRTWDDQGRQLNRPERLQGDPNVGPMAQGIALFDSLIQQGTGGAAPNRLGVGQSVQSGKAIGRLQEEEQFNTSNFLDNLGRSMRYEGQIINNLLYPIYGARPGRLVRILTGEGESQTIQVSDPSQQAQAQQLDQRAKQVAKLTKDAHFNVIVKIAKNSENRRLAEASALSELISADPALMTWFGDLYLKAGDTPNRKQLADRAKVMLAPAIQQMLSKQAQGQAFDPAAQAQIAQLTQQLQEVGQAAQQMQQELQTKQAENQAKVQAEQVKAQADERMKQAEFARDIELQRMQDATTIAVAELNLKAKGILSAQEAQHEAIALHQEQAHDVGMTAMTQQHASDLASQQAQHGQDAAMQQAALEPPPPPEIVE